jgi:hypothetical protein
VDEWQGWKEGKHGRWKRRVDSVGPKGGSFQRFGCRLKEGTSCPPSPPVGKHFRGQWRKGFPEVAKLAWKKSDDADATLLLS